MDDGREGAIKGRVGGRVGTREHEGGREGLGREEAINVGFTYDME